MLESRRQRNAEHEQFEKEKEKLSSLKFSVGDGVISDAYSTLLQDNSFFRLYHMFRSSSHICLRAGGRVE